MTEVLRHGIVAKAPDVVLSGDVEFDELYVVAGHKGNPEAVRAKGREGRRNRLKGGRGRGTLEIEGGGRGRGTLEIEGGPRSRHPGEGEATDLRHD
jgi:hypothetical protein